LKQSAVVIPVYVLNYVLLCIVQGTQCCGIDEKRAADGICTWRRSDTKRQEKIQTYFFFSFEVIATSSIAHCESGRKRFAYIHFWQWNVGRGSLFKFDDSGAKESVYIPGSLGLPPKSRQGSGEEASDDREGAESSSRRAQSSKRLMYQDNNQEGGQSNLSSGLGYFC